MISEDERSRRMDAARIRAELTIQELWLRYIALGGTSDAFDLDGYLQRLAPLDVFQQDVLAQALNEALEDLYRAHRIPLSDSTADAAEDQRLGALVQQLLRDRPSPRSGPASSGPGGC